MANSNSNSGGIGFFGLLGIIFIVLKLTGYIAWSWWLVLLPLYFGFVILFGGIILTLVIAGFALVIAWLLGRR